MVRMTKWFYSAVILDFAKYDFHDDDFIPAKRTKCFSKYYKTNKIKQIHGMKRLKPYGKRQFEHSFIYWPNTYGIKNDY